MSTDLINVIGHVINLSAVLLVGGTGLRKLGRLEQRLDLLWAWFKREHDLDENGHNK